MSNWRDLFRIQKVAWEITDLQFTIDRVKGVIQYLKEAAIDNEDDPDEENTDISNYSKILQLLESGNK